MTARRRPPNRRPAATSDIEIAGLRYKVSIGYCPRWHAGRRDLRYRQCINQATHPTWPRAMLEFSCRSAFNTAFRSPPFSTHYSRNSDGTAAGVIGAVLDMIARIDAQ